MTNTDDPAHANYPATLPDDAINALIAEGRAQPWKNQLQGGTPDAVLLDGSWGSTEHGMPILTAGIWYAVYGDSDGYRLATPELAAILTRDAARLRAADQAVADADARNGT
ncbi:MAG: hypothetical protein ACRD0P_40395 [Stackebrandtia sp.]